MFLIHVPRWLASVLFFIFIYSNEATGEIEPPMRFELVGNGGNCAGCEWIRAEGRITPKTPAQFRLYLAREGDAPFLLRFDSKGGDIKAAIELGRIIRSRDYLVTEVAKTQTLSDTGWHSTSPGTCIDACVLAFLGGAKRIVGRDVRIGFTKNFTGSDNAEHTTSVRRQDFRQNVGRIAEFLADLELPIEILSAAFTSEGAGPVPISHAKLSALKIDNSEDSLKFQPWQVKVDGPNTRLVSTSLDVRRTIQLSCGSESGESNFWFSFQQRFRRGYAADQLENIRETLEAVWITIAGRSAVVDSNEIRVEVAGDELRVEFALPEEISAQLTVDGATMFIKPDGLPDAYRDVLNFPSVDHPVAIAADSVRFVGRRCG